MANPKEKKSGKYIPERGDLVWLNFNPISGHEQAGKRPALVLSPLKYNERVGLALCCPITSRVKGYPFEVSLDQTKSIKGVVLSDQIKSLDWRARNAQFIERATSQVVTQTLSKIRLLL